MDKREKGLIEIQKLNKALQTLKSGGSLPDTSPSSNSSKINYPSTPTSKILQTQQSFSSSANDMALANVKNELFNTSKEMKECLDVLYKEIINMVTDQNLIQKL